MEHLERELKQTREDLQRQKLISDQLKVQHFEDFADLNDKLEKSQTQLDETRQMLVLEQRKCQSLNEESKQFVDQYKRDSDGTQDQIRILEQQLVSLRDELRTKTSAINNLRLAESELQNQLSQALNSCETTKQNLTQEQARSVAALKLIQEQTQHDINDMRLERDEMHHSLEEQKDIVKAHQKDKSAREVQIANLTALHSETLKAGEALNMQLNTMRANLALIESDAKQQITHALHDLNQAQEEAKTHSDEIKALLKEKSTREIQMANVKAAHDEAVKTCDQFANQIQSLHSNYKLMEAQIRHENEDAKMELERLRREHQQQSQAIDAFVVEKAQKETALTNAKALHQEALKTAEQLAAQVQGHRHVLETIETQAKHDCEEYRAREEAALRDLKKAKDTVTMLRSQLGPQTVQLEESKKALGLASSRLEVMEQNEQQVERRINELRDLLGQRNAAAERLQRQADEALLDSREARNERDSVRSDLGSEMDQLRKDKRTVDERLRELENMLSARDTAASRLELLADEAKRNLDNTRRELDSMRSKLGAQVDSLTTSLKIANLEVEDKDLRIATLENGESTLKLALQQSQMVIERVAKEMEVDSKAIATLENRFKTKEREAIELSDVAGYYERLLVALSVAMPLAAWAKGKSKL